MTFKQKNTTVTLLSFVAIMGFFLMRLSQMRQNDAFTAPNIFQLWGVIILLATVVTITALILTHLLPLVMHVIRTGDENPEVDDLEDERDRMIDLQGTAITQTVASIGSFAAMATFVFGQPALVMFTLLLFFGVLAQIVGDVRRLWLYQGIE